MRQSPGNVPRAPMDRQVSPSPPLEIERFSTSSSPGRRPFAATRPSRSSGRSSRRSRGRLPRSTLRRPGISRPSASSAWRRIRVWDAASGKRVKDLPAQGSVSVAFSPDGGSPPGATRSTGSGRSARGGRACRSGGTTRAGQPGRMAFSADGTVAIVDSLMEVGLVKPATGREIATLEAPDPEVATRSAFLPPARSSPQRAAAAPSSSGTWGGSARASKR